MKVGIIGLPNVGKSTLFQALTKKQVDVENYPFCTIDPNIGVVEVPDKRLAKLAEISQSKKIVSTVIEFVDIAGLVKNAHKGEGLGNQFLSHIREVDAIVEVLRDFEDKNITHVEGSINPERDQSIIHLELVMADFQTVEKRLEKISKEVKTGDKNSLKILNILNSLKKVLDQGQLASQANLNNEENKIIQDLHLLTLKPIIFVKNINNQSSVISYQKNFIQINAKQESEYAELSDQELKELGVERTGLDKLIATSYNILNLITYLTTGPQETRAWTIKQGTKAPQAAGIIHTDFEKGFIRAEVCKYNDFISAGSELKAKEKGLVRLEGKEYIVQDGDVVYFRIAE
ncbi:redox-regulated ATPase YchF [Candidatus Parcubacteria bacterium]|nr:redox-regulated ATPase YchF [Patescibacteria group bacterium]MBU4481875.1 redox-regulated ATPase YchF [Patescibacteria group bacterium]MCG2686581.1 redox-regulated ATPase YchF [Candidatus Parcubacteria bacterium]